jgi:hypothetical protein
MSNRTAILLYCHLEDAQTVRERARLENRTVSGYLLHIVMRSVEFEKGMLTLLNRPKGFRPPVDAWTCPPGPKTTMLLRCSIDQAKAIRTTAKQKGISVSGFVRCALRRSWKAEQSWTQQVA